MSSSELGTVEKSFASVNLQLWTRPRIKLVEGQGVFEARITGRHLLAFLPWKAAFWPSGPAARRSVWARESSPVQQRRKPLRRRCLVCLLCLLQLVVESCRLDNLADSDLRRLRVDTATSVARATYCSVLVQAIRYH